MDIDDVTGQIIDSAIAVHMRIGPGLLESVYQVLLAGELTRRGLDVQRHKQVVFDYDGITFNEGLRVDMLINDLVVVELKSVEALAPVHTKQLLTYLRLMDRPVGLLINFGGATVKEGLRRVVNRYRPTSPHPPRLPTLRGSA
jgi:GxxExxY protein